MDRVQLKRAITAETEASSDLLLTSISDADRQAITNIRTALPNLSEKEAYERLMFHRRVADALLKEGRCTFCGVEGHVEDSCRLKRQSDAEINAERRRRSAAAIN